MTEAGSSGAGAFAASATLGVPSCPLVPPVAASIRSTVGSSSRRCCSGRLRCTHSVFWRLSSADTSPSAVLGCLLPVASTGSTSRGVGTGSVSSAGPDSVLGASRSGDGWADSETLAAVSSARSCPPFAPVSAFSGSTRFGSFGWRRCSSRSLRASFTRSVFCSFSSAATSPPAFLAVSSSAR